MKLQLIMENVVSLNKKLFMLREECAAAAQVVYDKWEPNSEGFDIVFGDGGICDEIANAIGGVLDAHDISRTDGGHGGDDHAYIVAFDDNSTYIIDINQYHYESGGGMKWTKIKDVTFIPEMVEITKSWRPDWV